MATKPQAKSSVLAKKELSNNNYIAAVVVITLLIVVICGLVGKGLISSLILNTKVVAGEYTANKDMDNKLENIPQLIDNYNKLGYKKDLIAQSLPNTPDFPQLVTLMQGVSTASAVKMKSIAPDASGTTGGAAAADSASPYIFSVSIVGSYPQVVEFFKNLELSSRPMRVQNVQLSGEDSNLTAEVTLQTYYQGKADISDKEEAVK